MKSSRSSRVTQFLEKPEPGNRPVAEQLFAEVYTELRSRWPRDICGGNERTILFSRRRWCTRPTCGWWSAAILMADPRAPLLPVLDPETGALVGIVTRSDVLNAYRSYARQPC